MKAAQEMEERIINLETRIAFQEKMVEDLSSVLVQQQSSIAVLVEQLSSLKEQVGNGIADKGGDTKPPHY